jgi:manganese transport protein
VAALLLAETGIDPLKLVDYSIVFAMVTLPLTYLPVLLLAEDKEVMGAHVNSRLISVLGWIFLGLISIAALAALPLMVLTQNGKP